LSFVWKNGEDGVRKLKARVASEPIGSRKKKLFLFFYLENKSS